MLTTYFTRQTTQATYYSGPAGPYRDPLLPDQGVGRITGMERAAWQQAMKEAPWEPGAAAGSTRSAAHTGASVSLSDSWHSERRIVTR